MTPLEAFRRYLAIKDHFKLKNYDILKTSILPVPESRFDKYRFKKFFERLASEYIDTNLIGYIVSNFVENGGLNLFEKQGKRIYNEYIARLKNFDYVFESELQDILLQSERLKRDPFECEENYSIIVQMYLGKKLSPETLIILNSFREFREAHDRAFQEDYLWQDISLLLVKYRPFVRVAHKLPYYKEIYNNILGNQEF